MKDASLHFGPSSSSIWVSDVDLILPHTFARCPESQQARRHVAKCDFSVAVTMVLQTWRRSEETVLGEMSSEGGKVRASRGQMTAFHEDGGVIKAGHLQGEVLELKPADLQQRIRIPNAESPSFVSFKNCVPDSLGMRSVWGGSSGPESARKEVLRCEGSTRFQPLPFRRNPAGRSKHAPAGCCWSFPPVVAAVIGVRRKSVFAAVVIIGSRHKTCLLLLWIQ